MTIKVDPCGFVYVDGVKVCRYIPERNSLQFHDRDRRRSALRGAPYVELPTVAVTALEQYCGETGACAEKTDVS